MVLLIDTSDKEKINLRLEKKISNKREVLARLSLIAPRLQSEKLLPAICSLLKKKAVNLSAITEIRVASVGGSFTALRIGIATANALAYALNIPVYPIESQGQLKKSRGLKIVAPEYNREPSIGS